MLPRSHRGLVSANLLIPVFMAMSLVLANSPKNTTNTLIQVLKAQLPQGWTISFHEKESWIEIKRVKPELMFTIAPNLSGEEKPTSQNYTIGLSVIPLVSKEKYKKFQSENETTVKKMDFLYNALTHSRPIWGWPDVFHPTNDEEKREFEEYKRLDSSLHSLPDFYFGDLSLSCSPESQDPVDDKVRDECRRVKQKVTQTLSTY